MKNRKTEIEILTMQKKYTSENDPLQAQIKLCVNFNFLNQL
jgi:hypothetical protein